MSHEIDYKRLRSPPKQRYGLTLFLTLFQVAFIVLFAYKCKSVSFDKEEAPRLYPMFMDVHSMMFVGFGFLMTFLKRYGYGAIGFNFLVAAYVLELSLLVRGLLHSKFGSFTLNIESLLVADFCAAAVLISFGAVIGKASISQLIIMATIEVIVQSFNEYIGLEFLKAYDIGESMYVHVFGAYFGLAVAKVLNNRDLENENESSTYNSDLFSMIGTIFLWIYWPSFNSAVAKDEGQMRAIVNTYLSIASSCITTFIISTLVGKGKLNMVHVQNATLAGGVAVGTMADMAILPSSAMMIGSVAGVVSTLGFEYVTPLLKKIYLHDTCGVNNLHGMPGLISGIGGAIVATFATTQSFTFGEDTNRMYTFYPSRIPIFNSTEYLNRSLNATEYSSGGYGRSGAAQGAYQMAALCLTLIVAIVSGMITGLIMKSPIFEQIKENDEMFDDQSNWITPSDYAYHGKSNDNLEQGTDLKNLRV